MALVRTLSQSMGKEGGASFQDCGWAHSDAFLLGSPLLVTGDCAVSRTLKVE